MKAPVKKTPVPVHSAAWKPPQNEGRKADSRMTRVEQTLLIHGPQTAEQITQHLAEFGYTPEQVAQSISVLRQNMRAHKVGVAAGNGRHGVYAYGPGVRAKAKPNQLSVHERATYNGAELQRQPGITPERFAAFSLPSRIGNRLHYPDGRVEVVA